MSAASYAQAPAPPIEKNDAPIDVRVDGESGGAPRASRDPDVASFVVRGEDLKRPGATAVDVIAASPGVEPSRSGAGADLATISIRGAPSAQVPVYLAGIRLNDDVTGSADLSTIPLYFLDRVEVYRGNAPADATRLGIGGALFFEPRLPRGTHAGIRAGAGSFGELTMGAFASLGDERSGAVLSFSRDSATNDFTYTDDRATPDPADDRVVRRKNGDATSYDAWAIGRTTLPSGGRLVIVANAFAREQGVASATYAPASEARSSTQREILATSARLPCGSGAGGIDTCSIDVASSVITSRRELTDPLRELGLGGGYVTIAGDRWEESARWRGRFGDRLRLSAGVSGGVDRLGVEILHGLTTHAARLSLAGSADVAYRPAEPVELFGLVAGECHSSLGGGEACALGGPAGRAGVRLAAPLGFEVIASGGSYVRVPTLGELFGLSGAVQGNPALVPERGYAAEASVRWGRASSTGDVRGYLDVTGFARFAEDLIVYRRSGAATQTPFNVASARVIGVEAAAGIDMVRHVRAQVSLTAQDARDTSSKVRDSASALPFHAPFSSVSMVEAYADMERSVPVVSRLSLAVRFAYRAPRWAAPGETRYLAEQKDLAFDGAIGLFRGRIVARLGVSNALDTSNQDLLGFPRGGRAVHAGLEATW
ncbi:MAG: TonB-dependent receptor [Polyangiaceae bacterium]